MCEELDLIRGEFGVVRRGHDFFSVVYKHFHAVAVDDEPQLDAALVVVYLRAALVDDGAAGAGELAVNFEDGFAGAEAHTGVIDFIFGKSDREAVEEGVGRVDRNL